MTIAFTFTACEKEKNEIVKNNPKQEQEKHKSLNMPSSLANMDVVLNKERFDFLHNECIHFNIVSGFSYPVTVDDILYAYMHMAEEGVQYHPYKDNNNEKLSIIIPFLKRMCKAIQTNTWDM